MKNGREELEIYACTSSSTRAIALFKIVDTCERCDHSNVNAKPSYVLIMKMLYTSLEME